MRTKIRHAGKMEEIFMIRKVILPGLLLIGLLFVLGGCGASKASNTLKIDKIVNGASIEILTNNVPGNNTVICILKDEKGNSIADAKINGKLYMPSMLMNGYPSPMQFTSESGGRYTAIAQIKHGGDWRIDLSIITPKGTLENIPIDLGIGIKE